MPAPGGAGPKRRVLADLARSPMRAFVVIFLTAFALRGAVLVSGVLPDVFFRPLGENGRVATSLARTGRFADPYMIPTGPTAHPTPVYAGTLGLIYRAFGVTPTANHVRGLLAITAFSALYAMLPWLAIRFGLGARAGVVGGFAGALIPQQGLGEIIGGSDQPFPGLALGLLAVAFVRRWTGGFGSAAGLLLLGFACGFAFHLSPPLLPVVLGWLAFELAWSRDPRKWWRTGCVVLGAVAACLPWAWRNYTAFNELLFIRGNFGLELRLANHDGADADLEVTARHDGEVRHPSAHRGEAEKVRDLGEAEYMRQARNETVEWMRHHPGEFLRLTLLRVVHFWCGPLRYPWQAAAISAVTLLAFFGLRRAWPALSMPQRAALLGPFLLFPLVYYVVSYLPHYRAPLEGLLLLLAGNAVQNRMISDGRNTCQVPQPNADAGPASAREP
jgi:4-amino-4-deoxy-L-arabinose transferase-like glycosyltransferase